MTFTQTRTLRSVLLISLFLASVPLHEASGAAPRPSATRQTRVATFAGGCFWCMEPPFETLPGVISVTSGFSGGPEKDPTYREVSSGATGHAEAIQITYDPGKITYEKLLYVYWRNIDPTQANGQFCDRGAQYRSAIFYHDPTQRRLAEDARKQIANSRRLAGPIVTQIVAYASFTPAEEYHQDYYKKNAEEYHRYRAGCGRDARLRRIWGSEAAAH